MQGGYPSPCVRCTLLPSGHFPLRGVRKARKLLTCALQHKRHTRRKGGNSCIAVVRAHFVRYNINGQFYQMREERLRHARNCRRFQYFPLGTTFESTTASKLCSPQQHSTRKASPALFSQVGSKRSSTTNGRPPFQLYISILLLRQKGRISGPTASAKRFASVRSRTEPENVGSKITPTLSRTIYVLTQVHATIPIPHMHDRHAYVCTCRARMYTRTDIYEQACGVSFPPHPASNSHIAIMAAPSPNLSAHDQKAGPARETTHNTPLSCH